MTLDKMVGHFPQKVGVIDPFRVMESRHRSGSLGGSWWFWTWECLPQKELGFKPHHHQRGPRKPQNQHLLAQERGIPFASRCLHRTPTPVFGPRVSPLFRRDCTLRQFVPFLNGKVWSSWAVFFSSSFFFGGGCAFKAFVPFHKDNFWSKGVASRNFCFSTVRVI